MTISTLVVGDDDFPFHRLERMGPVIGDAIGSPTVDVTLTTDRSRLTADALAAHDVFVDYRTDPRLAESQLDGLRTFVASGGGYVGVHCAADLTTTTDGTLDRPYPGLRDLLGGHFRDHPEQTAFDVVVVDTHHPITAGLDRLTVWDEPYDCVVDDDVRVLARMDHPELGDTPVVWVTRHGEGRVAYCSLGHDRAALTDPGVETLLERAVAWAAGEGG